MVGAVLQIQPTDRTWYVIRRVKQVPKAVSLTSDAYYEARLPHYVVCGCSAMGSSPVIGVRFCVNASRSQQVCKESSLNDKHIFMFNIVKRAPLIWLIPNELM